LPGKPRIFAYSHRSTGKPFLFCSYMEGRCWWLH